MKLNGDELSSDQKERIVQKLLKNSGASLEKVRLPSHWFLTTRTIKMMAEMCPILRRMFIYGSHRVQPPESIRYLIDRIVERPQWNPNRDKLELMLLSVSQRKDLKHLRPLKH